jgi:hypothetical protein
VTPKQALTFVHKHGVVLQAARGPVPSLAEYITGGPIKGSWWAHPQGHQIFELATAVSDHPDVLVCKLIDGKVTYVHRRLWPALVKLAARFDPAQLARVDDEHTKTGAHRSITTPFPNWLPDDVVSEAQRLSVSDAERLLGPILASSPAPKRRKKGPS